MSHRDFTDRFLDASAAHPQAVAISEASGDTTYRDFEARVRRFAAAFAARPQPRVLIALPQTADAYAAIFAASLAGGNHTPLNVQAPIAKLRRITGMLQPDFIVGVELAGELSAEAPDAVLLDPAALPAEHFEGRGERSARAYTLFTSGSTGQPKGVPIPRAAIANYVQWIEDAIRPDPGDRFSQQPNLAFDISMTDIFGALCFGATLVPVAQEIDRLMPARFIAREKITVWNSTPSAMSLMMQARQATAANFASLRLINFCGEPLLREHLEAIFAARPDLDVNNTYGPTEATIAVTQLDLTRETYERHCGASVAIGPTIPGVSIELIGGSHADEGEIAIFGDQLAEGYWEDAEKTAAAFRTVDGPDGPRRAYFTGDWAERRDGDIYFKERLDFQVKVHGHRIELDEVAAAIRAAGWPVVCVFKRGEGLSALVESRAGETLDEKALRRALESRIEQFAIPESIRETERMPRNENDKLDRAAAARLFEELAQASRK
jgi:D-alanine--poly(phosphoribitol) ligase subunit 1